MTAFEEERLSELRLRAQMAEENLEFAQQRAADNDLRARIGEDMIRKLTEQLRKTEAEVARLRDTSASAETERDHYRTTANIATNNTVELRERAERAERLAENLEVQLNIRIDEAVKGVAFERVARAEAKLARVRALCDEEDFDTDCVCCVPVVYIADIRAAIEEES